jgi:hypothetical protein
MRAALFAQLDGVRRFQAKNGRGAAASLPLKGEPGFPLPETPLTCSRQRRSSRGNGL